MKTTFTVGFGDTIHLCTEHNIFYLQTIKNIIYFLNSGFSQIFPATLFLNPVGKFRLQALMTAVKVPSSIYKLLTRQFNPFGKSLFRR